MKSLIIGSKGFIGSNLVKYLNSSGHQVFEADVVVDYENPEHYFLVDATNSDYHSIFEQVQFDVCVNCSGAASVPDSIKKPHRDFVLNATNVFKLLEAIRVHQPACKFINLSSAAVYGNPRQLPISEKMEAKPISPYGYHKWMSEQICIEFHKFFWIKNLQLANFFPRMVKA